MKTIEIIAGSLSALTGGWFGTAMIASGRYWKGASVFVLGVAMGFLCLMLAACSTQAELACQNGQALAGYTPQETCLLGQIQRANMNAEAAAALGVVAVGVGTYAAIEANRPRTQTYLVTPTGPFSNNYMITGPYGQ